jgi:hypothetical protein
MPLPDFLILTLATWFAAKVISSSNLFAPLRERISLGGLVSCIVCLSPWCFAALWLVWLTPVQPLVWVLAGAGGALMLGSYSGATHQ